MGVLEHGEGLGLGLPASLDDVLGVPEPHVAELDRRRLDRCGIDPLLTCHDVLLGPTDRDR